jgi:hypothetical protein
MGNQVSTSTTSNLAIEIDRIASKYILSQNFNDMNKLSEKGHCDKLVILTAKIINQNLNALEQKEVVNRIYPPAQANGVGPREQGPTQVYGPREQGPREQGPREQGPREQGPREQGQVYGPPQMGGTDCVKIAKFYVKIAHIYAAIMKTINPVITTQDNNGNKKKYDLMNKSTLPSAAEIKTIEHNNFCSRRLNSLLQEKDYNRSDPNNVVLTLKPRFCQLNYDEATKTTRVLYNDSNSADSELGIPELMKLYYDVYDVSVGDFTSMSPETRTNVYEKDVETFYKAFTGKPIPLDENGNKLIYRFDQIPLREFHKTDKCLPNGILAQNYEGSLNENLFEKYAAHVNKMLNTMNSNQDKLVEILKKLFTFKILTPEEKNKRDREKASQPQASQPQAQASQPQAQVSQPQAQANQPQWQQPEPQWQQPEPQWQAQQPEPQWQAQQPQWQAQQPQAPYRYEQQAGAESSEEEEEVIINPNLDDDLLKTLVNTTRQLIVELYVTCETDFLEGVTLFEGIVAVQLAKTTQSQISALDNMALEYVKVR